MTPPTGKPGTSSNVQFVAEVDILPTKSMQQLAPEPTLDVEKANIWKS